MSTCNYLYINNSTSFVAFSYIRCYTSYNIVLRGRLVTCWVFSSVKILNQTFRMLDIAASVRRVYSSEISVWIIHGRRTSLPGNDDEDAIAVVTGLYSKLIFGSAIPKHLQVEPIFPTVCFNYTSLSRRLMSIFVTSVGHDSELSTTVFLCTQCNLRGVHKHCTPS